MCYYLLYIVFDVTLLIHYENDIIVGIKERKKVKLILYGCQAK